MSSKGLMCTVVWTELLGAMRQDGLIAHCVLAAGPATTAFIKELVENLPEVAPVTVAPVSKPDEYVTVEPGGKHWCVMLMRRDYVTGLWAVASQNASWANKRDAVDFAKEWATNIGVAFVDHQQEQEK